MHDKLIEGALRCEQRIPKINRHIEIIPVLQAIFCDGEGDWADEGAIHNRDIGDILQVIGNSHLCAAVHGIEGCSQIEMLPKAEGWHKARSHIS